MLYKMNKKLGVVFLIALVAFIVIFSGCVSTQSKEEIAKKECISLCMKEKSMGRDLSQGPCLSDNNPNWNVSDWVCVM